MIQPISARRRANLTPGQAMGAGAIAPGAAGGDKTGPGALAAPNCRFVRRIWGIASEMSAQEPRLAGSGLRRTTRSRSRLVVARRCAAL
jgi:hypothetical protein